MPASRPVPRTSPRIGVSKANSPQAPPEIVAGLDRPLPEVPVTPGCPAPRGPLPQRPGVAGERGEIFVPAGQRVGDLSTRDHRADRIAGPHGLSERHLSRGVGEGDLSYTMRRPARAGRATSPAAEIAVPGAGQIQTAGAGSSLADSRRGILRRRAGRLPAIWSTGNGAVPPRDEVHPAAAGVRAASVGLRSPSPSPTVTGVLGKPMGGRLSDRPRWSRVEEIGRRAGQPVRIFLHVRGNAAACGQRATRWLDILELDRLPARAVETGDYLRRRRGVNWPWKRQFRRGPWHRPARWLRCPVGRADAARSRWSAWWTTAARRPHRPARRRAEGPAATGSGNLGTRNEFVEGCTPHARDRVPASAPGHAELVDSVPRRLPSTPLPPGLEDVALMPGRGAPAEFETTASAFAWDLDNRGGCGRGGGR